MSYNPEHVANGAVPSHHWVQVPDEYEVGGHRSILQVTTIHEARIVARRHAAEFAFIHSVPMGQDALGDFQWVDSTWDGRIISSGFGIGQNAATVEDREAELTEWLSDPSQALVASDIAREDAYDEEINRLVDDRKEYERETPR